MGYLKRLAAGIVVALVVALLFVLALNHRSGDTTAALLGKVAFVRDGNLWVRSLPSSAERQLTTGGTGARPRWSPSGQWILFAVGPPADPADIGVYVMRVDGTAKRRIDAVGYPAWSPTDDVLAIARTDGTFAIERADGTGRRQLLPAVPGGGTLDRRLDLDWSSDGQWVLYEEQHQDHVAPRGGFAYVGIRAVRADGTGEHELFTTTISSEGIVDASGLPYRWAGSGVAGQVSLAGNATTPVDVAGMPVGLRILAASRQDDGSVGMLTYRDFAAVSPDGHRIALVAGLALRGYPPQASGPTPATSGIPPPRDAQSQKQIVLMDADTGQVMPLSPAMMVAVSPSWSPNGRSLAFVARPDNGPVDITQATSRTEASRRIWTIASDGSSATPLAIDGADCRQERPLWSADASHIVFACVDSELTVRLYLVPSSGGTAVEVASGVSQFSSQGRAALLPEYQGHIDWDLFYDYWPGPR